MSHIKTNKDMRIFVVALVLIVILLLSTLI